MVWKSCDSFLKFFFKRLAAGCNASNLLIALKSCPCLLWDRRLGEQKDISSSIVSLDNFATFSQQELYLVGDFGATTLSF